MDHSKSQERCNHVQEKMPEIQVVLSRLFLEFIQ